MNNMKAKRKLRGYWIKGDIVGWINQKYRMKHYTKETKHDTSLFNIDMVVWNERFTHEEIQLHNYEGWEPYCMKCDTIKRMDKTEDGWQCSNCRIKIGKHLYRIGNVKLIGLLSKFNKESGRPRALIQGYNTNGI